MGDYNNTSAPIVFPFTPHDTNRFQHPVNSKYVFSRAIRASAACTLKIRTQGKRYRPEDTAVIADDQTLLFAAGETRSVAADMVYSTGSTLNGATIEVYL